MQQEHIIIEHRIVEDIEKTDSYPYEKVTRTLYDGDEELYREIDSSGNIRGKLGDIVKSIYELSDSMSEDKCLSCRYKVGDYRGDISYLLYLSFRSRLRLQFFKFKLHLRQIAEKYFGLKHKAPSVKKRISSSGEAD